MLNPVIKWVGGKRQLLSAIKERMPKEFGTYYEPFFGGGAVYFGITPKKAVINDFNEQLVNLYKQIKAHCDEIMRLLTKWGEEYNQLSSDAERDAYYYGKRNLYNDCLLVNDMSILSAALVIFLNKAGFNGLYRVNQNGQYNVPPGHKKKLNLFDEANMKAVSKAFTGAKIMQGDFEVACKNAKAGDFVFFDSPYYDTFDTYQAGGFSEEDHKRLYRLFAELSDKGVYCMLTNNSCDYIKNLYAKFNVETIKVKRMVNCDATKRTGEEVIITNYKL